MDPHESWHDPSREAALVVAAAPGPLLEALAAERGRHGPRLGRVLARADALVPPLLAAMPEAFEGRVPAALEPALPDDALVWLSYSMPIRDVEAFFPASPKPLRFLAGRGANGIDGVVSSAAGAAIGSGRPTFVVTGDVALVHDVGGLLAAARAGVDLTVVCVNNDGGGIFDFLPGGGSRRPRDLRAPHRDPHGVDMAALARLAGLEHRVAAGAAELRAAVPLQASWRCAPTARTTSGCTPSWCAGWPSRS